MNNPVLIIDDDEKLTGLMTAFFSKHNLSLIVANTPSDGLKKLEADAPAVVILDVMLPEMDGFEVCKTIRKSSNVPIIMLTARGDVSDRVTGLEIGADDYLPKPFDPRELLVRVESILSRLENNAQSREANVIQFGDLTINRDSHEVSVKDILVSLTTKEYALLTLFADNPNVVFSRDDIMNELSGIDSELFSRSVDILVSRLRNKLKPLNVIHTVWGSGYKFSLSEDALED